MPGTDVQQLGITRLPRGASDRGLLYGPKSQCGLRYQPFGRCPARNDRPIGVRMRLRKWTPLIDDGPCSPLKGCCSGASSRRPLRPFALPAPRPRIAIELSTCGSGGPCRAHLRIADPRYRVEHIVVHRNREGLVLLLDKGSDQILAPALEVYPPQALRQIKPTALEDWDQTAYPVFLRQLATQLDYVKPIIVASLLLPN